MNAISIRIASALLWLTPAAMLAGTATTTQSLSITMNAAGKLSAPASVALVSSGAAFSSKTGTGLVNYKVRTGPSGSGSLVVQAAEFSPTTGPTISSGALTYSCAAATVGTACSGSQTLSTTAQRNVVTIPANACTGGGSPCSSSTPASVSLGFTVSDNPTFKTGSYSSTLTFTISTL